MGNVTSGLLQKGHEVLFAYEEAIGYMFGTSVLDKDGVSGAAVMAECAVWLYANGKTLASQLEACYQRWVGHRWVELIMGLGSTLDWDSIQ